MDLSDSVPKFISSSSTSRFLPLPPILKCCPIQVQLPPANDCPASTHHVHSTTALIRMPLTEWEVEGMYTLLQHTSLSTLHIHFDTPLPRSNVTAFIPAVTISKVFIVSNSLRYLAASNLATFIA
ncbi:predicted protein [Lichtheimia corymbifera JMRC:FSU:9682]|uniref:Uncharacterized protein n=1 Tax=Lichtheimia corymbifera JMRC:FSU:9682 TaxID=1263082 RepID=A0A068RI18_9FUNG|nr:predicted protein [Lichtheimia corymbifera JMRC:FSU:9682]